MASKGGTTRQPLEQLKEMEKEGRIRRFLWDVVTLRMFAYVLAQPASFVFILSLVLITLSMPPIALYIKNADQLPDLDTMRSWNAYLGRLSSMKLCISEETYNSSEMESWNSSSSASAFLDFYVDRKFREYRAIAAHNFTGIQLRTKIKNGTSSKRIDDDVVVYIFLNLSSAGNCSSEECKVQGCVDIMAPAEATPTRRPQIPNTDFSFNTRVLHSTNKPEKKPPSSCLGHYRGDLATLDVYHLSLGSRCDDVRPQKERYRHHGLVNIDLTEVQKEEAYHRVLLGTLGMAATALAFAVGIACTDRPPKPKTSAE